MRKFLKSILRFLVGLVAVLGIMVGLALVGLLTLTILVGTNRFLMDPALFTDWHGCVASDPIFVILQITGFITVLLLCLFVLGVIFWGAWEMGKSIFRD